MDCPKILIIEEKKVLAVDISKSLQRLGYKYIEIIDSGEKAIQKIAEIHPNLVLLDICLSDGLGAIEMADMIEGKFHIPVLYMGEYGEVMKLTSQKLLQPFRYLYQPFGEKDLHIAVEMALYKSQVEKRLTEKVQKLTSIIDGVGSGIVVTNLQGDIEMMNPVAESLTGWRESEALQRHVNEVVRLVDGGNGELMLDLPTQVFNGKVTMKLPENCILIAKDGREIPVGDSIAPIRDRSGEICGLVFIFQDISQRKQMEAQLMRNAFYDALTALPNRVLFLDRLRQAFERAKRRHNYRFAVLFIDLDGFKQINDLYGHGMGDDLLIAIARRLEVCLRSGDTVARFGGDEFAAVLEDIKDETDATNIANRIQDSLSVPLQLNGQQLVVTASIGIAIHSDSHEEPANLLRDADIAMYRAKKLQGKASYAVFA